MSIDPVALLKRYHAALNAYDAAEVGPMFSAEAIYVSPGLNGRIEGREAIIAAFSAYFAEHPDQRAEDESIERTGPGEACAAWRLHATAASTGRQVVRRGIETVSFDAGGLITRVEVEDR
jgi:uncharacterized protein (TIGR02246 family)